MTLVIRRSKEHGASNLAKCLLAVSQHSREVKRELAACKRSQGMG